MIRMRTIPILIVVLLCAAEMQAQVDDVIVEFQSGERVTLDEVTCRDGILSSVRVRYLGEWNKTRVVDTLTYSLDSARAVILDEGSTASGTFIPVLIGSVLAGLAVGGIAGGLGGVLLFIAIAGVGSVGGLITGFASASDAVIYTPALPHDAAAIELILGADPTEERMWGSEPTYPSVRDLAPQLEFGRKNAPMITGRLLDATDENAVILVEETDEDATEQSSDIVTVPFSEVSAVHHYGNSGTAPWGTLLIGGGGLLMLSILENSGDRKYAKPGDDNTERNALITLGSGLLLDVIMGIRAASPSWEWNPAFDPPAELREMSLQHVLEVGNEQ